MKRLVKKEDFQNGFKYIECEFGIDVRFENYRKFKKYMKKRLVVEL